MVDQPNPYESPAALDRDPRPRWIYGPGLILWFFLLLLLATPFVLEMIDLLTRGFQTIPW